jgi:hypothetical protein
MAVSSRDRNIYEPLGRGHIGKPLFRRGRACPAAEEVPDGSSFVLERHRRRRCGCRCSLYRSRHQSPGADAPGRHSPRSHRRIWTLIPDIGSDTRAAAHRAARRVQVPYLRLDRRSAREWRPDAGGTRRHGGVSGWQRPRPPRPESRTRSRCTVRAAECHVRRHGRRRDNHDAVRHAQGASSCRPKRASAERSETAPADRRRGARG